MSGNKKRKKRESSSSSSSRSHRKKSTTSRRPNSPPVFAYVKVGKGERYVTITDPFILKKIKEQGTSGWKLDDVGRDEKIEIKWDNTTKEKVSVERVRIEDSNKKHSSSRTTRSSRTARGSSSRSSRTTRGGSSRSSSTMKQQCDMPGCKYTQKEQFDSDYNDEVYCSKHCKKKGDAAKKKELDKDIAAAEARKKKSKKKTQAGAINQGGRPRGHHKSSNDNDEDYNNHDDSDNSNDTEYVDPMTKTPKRSTGRKQKSTTNGGTRKMKTKYDTVDYLNSMEFKVSLRVARSDSKKTTFPQARLAIISNSYGSNKLTTASNWDNDVMPLIKTLIPNNCELNIKNMASVFYDSEYVSLPHDFTGNVSDFKSTSTKPITSEEEWKEALIECGYVSKMKHVVVDNDENEDEDGDDDDDDDDGDKERDDKDDVMYNLDLVLLLKEKKATNKKTKSKIAAVTTVKVLVTDVIIKETSTTTSKSPDGTESTTTRTQSVVFHERGQKKVKPIGNFSFDYKDLGGTVDYNTLRSSMYDAYKTDKKGHLVSSTSPIYILKDYRSNEVGSKLIRTDAVVTSINEIIVKTNTKIVNGEVDIYLGLGQKVINADDDGSITSSSEGTVQFGSQDTSSMQLQSPGVREEKKSSKAARKNSQKVNEEVEEIFNSYYDNSAQYRGKMCSEHHGCFQMYFNNDQRNIDLHKQQISNDVYPSLAWMSNYNICKTVGLPGAKDYPLDDGGNVPSGLLGASQNKSINDTILKQGEAIINALNNNTTGSSNNEQPRQAEAVNFVRFFHGTHQSAMSVQIRQLIIDNDNTPVNELNGGHLITKAKQLCRDGGTPLFRSPANNTDPDRVFVIDYIMRDQQILSEVFKAMPLNCILNDTNSSVMIELAIRVKAEQWAIEDEID